ncbi:hypothetical protein V6U89_24590 [Micromonospora sp. CPCC 206171]|uniref:hypothetical protein n=1 Tax=Micromonospora sp. CPCC 206171 TaxID=3122405 RepID=UPI002FF437C9
MKQWQSGGPWVSLGTYRFTSGSGGSVMIRTDGTDGRRSRRYGAGTCHYQRRHRLPQLRLEQY